MSRSLSGANDAIELKIGGGRIEVQFASSGFDLPQAALVEWVRRAARAVTAYYGRFPIAHARVRIVPGEGRHGVTNGRSFGRDGAFCSISVGQHVTEAELWDDWMLTHEMVHFSFPSVEDRHHWIEEGGATYVEPVARFRIGNLTAERVWGDMVRDMPQGLPEAGDEGLDNTATWGRTYWGGAIFCLLADVEIRKRTQNARGLEDALRAINKAGGTIDADWPLEQALETGDKATGGKVLMDLYQSMRAAPVAVDLPGLWKQLGVARAGGRVEFDDRAPLAGVRAAILDGGVRKKDVERRPQVLPPTANDKPTGAEK